MQDFNFDKFKNEKVAVHCNTKEKAEDFLDECREIGLKWHDGRKLEETEWDKYGMETCYRYDWTGGIRFSNIDFYEAEGNKIIEWKIKNMNKEFSKSDLKSGMVIELRTKERFIVVTEATAIGKSGFINLEKWEDDLTHNEDEKYDIVKVFNIQESFKCLPKNLHLAEGLFWERKELKEMTIEEIQKELGYKIKIVEANSGISQLKQSSGKCRGGF